MGAGRHLEPGEHPRVHLVGDIDERGAGRRTHVADECGRACNDDLAATGQSKYPT